VALPSAFNRLNSDDMDNAILPMGKDISVSFDDNPRRIISDENGSIEYTGQNEEDPILVTFGKQRTIAPSAEAQEHHANLAEFLSDIDNNRLADELMEMIEADEQSNEPWRDKLAKGLEVMGFIYTKGEDLPFSGASDVTHPLIAEAVVQFNARAGSELLPPGGPCKGLVVGEHTQEKRDQADRLEMHMNYQMTEEDEGYYEEIDSMLFYLPFSGDGFTKTYWDDIHQITTTRFIKSEHVVAPYSAKSLTNSPRYTILDKQDRNTIRKHMASGLYRTITMLDAGDEDTINNDTQELYDDADGRTMVMHKDDPRHDIAEINIEYNLKGFEDKNEDGEDSGIALPYLITVDRTSRTVLAIYRNWDEQDPHRRRLHYVTHYKYLPGLGFHGFGLLHIIGGLAEACTGSMRAILDSAAFATLQGGFKSKDARVPAGELTLTPGVWHDIDLSAEEMESAFYTPPFKEPSPALFQMYKEMVNEGRRFAGTTENVVGDANNTGPVGTTVALIEQGTKVMSGIHKRLHRAQRREFKIRARINAENLPDGEVFYDSSDNESFITIHDYMNRAVNVVPVSDPNIVSATQRISQAQGILQLAETAPQLYRMHRVHYTMLQAMGVNDVDEYVIDPTKQYRFDAVSEGARVMAGLPIWAYSGQNHEQHLAIHMTQLEYFKTLPEEQAAPLIMAMTNHLAKTEGYRMYDYMARTMQTQLPPIDLYEDDPKQEMSPEIEMAVTDQASRFVAQLTQEIQAKQPPPPEDTEVQADMARKDAAFKQAEEQKQLAFQAEEQRKQIAWEAEQKRKESAESENEEGGGEKEHEQEDDGVMQAISDLSQRLNQVSAAVAEIAGIIQKIMHNPSKSQDQGAEDATETQEPDMPTA
jgi:hypothetical protein